MPLPSSQLPGVRTSNHIETFVPANSAGFDRGLLGMTLLKSFGMLVGGGEGAASAKRERRRGRSGDRRDRNVIAVIGKPKTVAGTTLGIAASKAYSPTPEARYAYYRRCQQFRRNGRQCKAPAVKGEPICHKHAEQAAKEERRERQRRELLASPGLGFGDLKAVQRTISAVAQALLDGRIDAKTAGRLIIELQTASKLLWQQQLLNHGGHRRTQRKEELRRQEPRKEEKQLTGKMNPYGCRERRWSAVAAQMVNPRECQETCCSAEGGSNRVCGVFAIAPKHTRQNAQDLTRLPSPAAAPLILRASVASLRATGGSASGRPATFPQSGSARSNWSHWQHSECAEF
jgi:hypothetical protein